MSISVKLNEKSLKDVEDLIKKAFNNVIRNKKMLTEIGEDVTKDIQFQTRAGNSIPNNEKLAPLKKSWILIRKRIAESQGTHQAYREKRSNLTLSGQLLNSLKAKVKGPGSVEVAPTGLRSRYKIKRKDGKGTYQLGKLITNQKLSEYVSKKRPYLGVRPIMKERIRRTVIGYIRRSSSVLKFI